MPPPLPSPFFFLPLPPEEEELGRGKSMLRFESRPSHAATVGAGLVLQGHGLPGARCEVPLLEQGVVQ